MRTVKEQAAHARAAGLKRFIADRPCRHGHVERRADDKGTCVVCHYLRFRPLLRSLSTATSHCRRVRSMAAGTATGQSRQEARLLGCLAVAATSPGYAAAYTYSTPYPYSAPHAVELPTSPGRILRIHNHRNLQSRSRLCNLRRSHERNHLRSLRSLCNHRHHNRRRSRHHLWRDELRA